MIDILLIDDNRNFCLGLAANLRKAGYKVTVISDSREGINLAQSMRPGLILCDLIMPAPDGMEVKRILNGDASTANIPFVFLSSSAAPDVKSSGLQIGADDYIIKSVDIVELIARIQAILKRKAKIDFLAHQEVQQILENLSTTLPVHTSHHFRTNLGVLLLSLEMLAKENAPAELYLDFARNSAYKIKSGMETLIWLNEYDMGRYERIGSQIDLENAFTMPINELMERWGAKKLKLDLSVEKDLILFAPVRPFTQAVVHLIDNACKFSPDGGLIQVRLVSRGAKEVIFTVEDQGIGIPLEMREAIFERFFQIPGEGGLPENHGMGLGLFMARAFARTRDGDVHILNAVDGCKVQMILKNKPTRHLQP
jgi:signal transduction histidine kinase